MPERKKTENLRKKMPEKSKAENSIVQDEKSVKINLTERIKATAEGLYYISETDAEIAPFAGKPAASVTKEEILSQTGSVGNSPIEEKSFSDFFARLTAIEDWFGDEEKETARKFGQLKALLENNLRDLQVFKVGEIEIKIYVVGLDAANVLSGIQTRAVET